MIPAARTTTGTATLRAPVTRRTGAGRLKRCIGVPFRVAAVPAKCEWLSTKVNSGNSMAGRTPGRSNREVVGRTRGPETAVRMHRAHLHSGVQLVLGGE